MRPRSPRCVAGLLRALVPAALLAGTSVAAQEIEADRHGISREAALGAGDGVRVTIYRQPQDSGEYSVDEAGYLVLPLVDRVNVLEKSVRQLEHELVQRYREFYRDPIILVTPLYRVNVLGEVRQPGLYPVDPTMTLPDVLALAGGLTPEGSFEKIHVLRSRHEQTLAFSDPESRAREIGELGLRSGDQIVVGEEGKGFWERAPLVASIAGGVAALVAIAAN